MTEAELMQLLAAITPPDDAARAAAHATGQALPSPWAGWGRWKRCWRTPLR